MAKELYHSGVIQMRRPKVSIEAWRRHYNEVRPHSSLAYLTPAAFKAKHLADVVGGR